MSQEAHHVLDAYILKISLGMTQETAFKCVANTSFAAKIKSGGEVADVEAINPGIERRAGKTLIYLTHFSR